jgi:hypothetical protein
MDYELYKWADDGAVEFRLHALSRASDERAPWVRVGFRLYGSWEQVRFYVHCCERIVRLTARELGLAHDQPPPAGHLSEARSRDAAVVRQHLLVRCAARPM